MGSPLLTPTLTLPRSTGGGESRGHLAPGVTHYSLRSGVYSEHQSPIECMHLSTSRRQFEWFLRRVHRRFVMLRLAERAGLGLVGGCAVAVPLLLVVWWRGLPGAELAILILGFGIVAGLLWGLSDLPTHMNAAMEADRQLDLADLLSSAISIRDRRGQDGWAEAVIAAADARCRSMSAPSVILNCLGARSWGGIGLATALVLVLAMLPTFATVSQANPNAAGSSVSLLPGFDSPESQHEPGRTSDRRAPGQEAPEDGMANRIGSEPLDQSQQTDAAAAHANNSGAAHADGGASGKGTGQSRSSAHDVGPASPRAGSQTISKSNSGRPSAGLGPATPGRSGRDESSADTAGSSPAPAVPPWQSSHWDADAQRANDAIRSGDVPDSYRDVIRGYFDQSSRTNVTNQTP